MPGAVRRCGALRPQWRWRPLFEEEEVLRELPRFVLSLIEQGGAKGVVAAISDVSSAGRGVVTICLRATHPAARTVRAGLPPNRRELRRGPLLWGRVRGG